MYVRAETYEERLLRLRRSVVWAHKVGTFAEIVRWEVTYSKAKRGLV